MMNAKQAHLKSIKNYDMGNLTMIKTFLSERIKSGTELLASLRLGDPLGQLKAQLTAWNEENRKFVEENFTDENVLSRYETCTQSEFKMADGHSIKTFLEPGGASEAFLDLKIRCLRETLSELG